MRTIWAGLVLGLAVSVPGAAHAETVSYSKEIVPIFKENCAKCHGEKQQMGGLSLASFAGLTKGGKSGKVLGAKAADSKLVQYVDGASPKMPPGGKLAKAQVDKIKAWVDAGAKADVAPDLVVIPDSAVPAPKIPKVALKVPQLAQVASLAWSKDGKILAIGSYQKVLLADPATGKITQELPAPADKANLHAEMVHSVEFSHDGKFLAAAGGPPAVQGEIKIWELATGKCVRTIVGHSDCIYSCSWSPDDKNIASASYDKLVKIWEVATGNEVKTLKDHADAVYCVAYNPQGTLLASGSADRSVKIWDVGSGKRIYTLTGHTDTVTSLAWNAKGNQLTSVGVDKTVRTWSVNAQEGKQSRNTTGHDQSINDVAYSEDGTLLATASNDHSVKVWKAGDGGTVANIKDQPDAMLSAAISPDDKLVAVGSFDGTLKVFNIADGKLQSTIIDLPKAPEPKTPAKAAPAKVDPKAPAKPDPKAAATKKAAASAKSQPRG